MLAGTWVWDLGFAFAGASSMLPFWLTQTSPFWVGWCLREPNAPFYVNF